MDLKSQHVHHDLRTCVTGNCTTCPSLTSFAGVKCNVCPFGQFYEGGACKKCPSCPSGKYLTGCDVKGLSSCTDCPVCPVGEYRAMP
eukprot:762484-Hanusia_phi.AAC.1